MLQIVDIVTCGFAEFRPGNRFKGREMKNAGRSSGLQGNPDDEISANINRQASQAKVEFRRQRGNKHGVQHEIDISLRIAYSSGCCS